MKAGAALFQCLMSKILRAVMFGKDATCCRVDRRECGSFDGASLSYTLVIARGLTLLECGGRCSPSPVERIEGRALFG